MLIFHRYVLPHMNANMYLGTEGEKALVIDPNRSEGALECLDKFGVKEVTILLTHEHFDHTSGVDWFADRFQCRVYGHAYLKTEKCQRKNNRPTLMSMLVHAENRKGQLDRLLKDYPPYRYKLDKIYTETMDITWNHHKIHFQHIPGHSPGSSLIEVDEEFVFTGDSLIPDIPTITRFPGSDAEKYREFTLPILHAIPENRVIMPGHGEIVKMGELRFDDGCFHVCNKLAY